MHVKILLMSAVLLSSQVYAQSTSKSKNKSKPSAAVSAKSKATTKEAPAPTAPSTPLIEEVKKEEEKKVEPPVAVAVVPATLPAKIFTYMKEKFSVSYHGEYYFVRRDIDSADKNDHDIQDLKVMHNPTIIYKPIKNWQLLATAEFKYTDAPAPGSGTFVNDYHRALLTLTRKNILTEKENGVQLDAGIGRRDYNTRTTPSLYGNDRIFTTLTKTYGKNNGSLFIQYLYNDPRKVSALTWEHALELLPTITIQLTEKISYLFTDDINFYTSRYKTNARDISMTHEMNLAYVTYQLTDKISTYYQFKYYHEDDFTNAPKDDYFEHYAGAAYALTPKATATFEIGSELFKAHDKKGFAKKSRYPELALYLDFSL